MYEYIFAIYLCMDCGFLDYLDATEYLGRSSRPAILDIHHENASCTKGGKTIHYFACFL